MFDLPPRLVVFIAAMLPFSELRGAIPLAIGQYGMNPLEAFVLGVLGNLVPVVFLLHFLGPIEQRLRFIRVFDRFFDHLFHRTRKKHSERIDLFHQRAGQVPDGDRRLDRCCSHLCFRHKEEIRLSCNRSWRDNRRNHSNNSHPRRCEWSALVIIGFYSFFRLPRVFTPTPV